MERTLQAERLFPLGDFKNVKFSNTLTGIPEELASNDKIVGLLFLQQVITCEIAYRKYYAILNKIAEEGIKDVLAYMEENRQQTWQELRDEINSVYTPPAPAPASVKIKE